MGVPTDKSQPQAAILCECGKPSTIRCRGHVLNGERAPVWYRRLGVRVCLAPLCRHCASLLMLCPKCAAVQTREAL